VDGEPRLPGAGGAVVSAEVAGYVNAPSTVALSAVASLSSRYRHRGHIGFRVETGKAKGAKIPVPVLFGLNNRIDKSFDADAVSADGTIVLEVEAGRAVANYSFLKDIFQACLMHKVEYLVLAVRNKYRSSDDFAVVHTFLETLYISNRLILPLKGSVLIGY
jgi:hypothetical protein